MNNNIITSRLFLFLVGTLLLCTPFHINAFSLSTYSENSILSEGKWVKISVPRSGIYLISNSDLQNWGFNNPSKVHVFGYGGKRLPDVLSKSTFIDDLPLVQSKSTSRGIVFYAQGPESWTSDSDDKFIHSLNPFTSVAYYYLSDRNIDETNEITKIGVEVDKSQLSDASTTFTESIFHEINRVNHGSTGHLFLGEDFKYTPYQTFQFSLPGIVNSDQVKMVCQFAAKTFNAATQLTFTVNGTTLSSISTDRIPSSSSSAYIHGKLTTTHHSFNISGNEILLGIKVSSQATIQMANLDYINFNYTRKIKLSNGLLKFRSNNTLNTVENATGATYIWDVTNPQKIYQLNTVATNNGVSFKNEYTGLRNYVAWNENASFPTPTFVQDIANQNIHAMSTPNMVIFTIPQWKDQANRLADLHRNSTDSLKVAVFTPDVIYNEFSSGVPDINAFRKLLKMFWDRGEVQGDKLKHALLFGRGTFDNQHLTPEMQALGYATLPLWQTDKGLDDNESFCTDDILAFLKDNSGSNMGSDSYCIGVGRIPARSVTEAKNAVDKIYRYVNNSEKGEWKNQLLMIADDMDNGIHMDQTESLLNLMNRESNSKNFIVNKLYIDAFTRESSSYPQAKTQMFRLLKEGTIWWNYIGHANTTSWTHDGLFSYTEMSTLYLKKYPFLYAATCEFLRWDAHATCGAEVMFNLTDGGTIATFSASRPVYIANNGLLTNALAPYILKRDETGRTLPIGEIVRLTKNGMFNTTGNKVSDRNKLRFSLMGDPAMRLAIPSSRINIETICGAYVDQGEQTIIQARQNVEIKGHIVDHNGKPLNDFTGTIHCTLYDAEKSTTTHGYTNGDDGKEVVFEEHGEKLHVGRYSVVNGEFTIRFSMPTEIAQNFRPGTLNLYAQADNGMEAIGCNKDLYIYGFYEGSDLDTIAPVINYLYLNHENFANGDMVNESPMLIAQVSDNVGINLSSAGVGHQMSLRLDGKKTYSDVSLYFTPMISDELSIGLIHYPVQDLPDGNHTLKLKVWDTSGNSTERSIDLFVKNGMAPSMFDVYTDANPAYNEVNFYIKHDRPDAITTVSVSVYDLMGRLVWESSRAGQSDMFTSAPLNWDLHDLSGRRVNRGIYVYRASITTDGQQYTSSSRKLAIGSPQ